MTDNNHGQEWRRRAERIAKLLPDNPVRAVSGFPENLDAFKSILKK